MKDKKVKLFSAIALVALALLVVGATYAYFQSQHGSASNADIKVTTNTTDLLTFETGDAINITADQETFAQGKGNRTGSTFARATLQANNKTNTATANYYVYLNISGNDFEYSKDSSSPELLLSITDNSGNQVTKLTGLNYITVTDGSNKSISGFDITKSSGLLTLVDNKEISASPKQIEEWNITITLVNYNYDQNANTGKNFSGKLIIQKEKMITSLADYVISQYTGTQGENNIYYHDSKLTNGAGDNSYRYAGANPNNYVCFGSNVTPCPADNLYRIIGVFGENNHEVTGKQLVKLIKYTSYGQYSWDNSSQLGSNVWETSSLNSILNYSFLTDDLKPYVTTVDWKVGGINSSGTSKEIYIKEITNSAKTVNEKVGLMYVSDYYYAVSPEYWEVDRYKYANKFVSEDWLFKKWQWTITPFTATEVDAFYIGTDGIAGAADNYVSTEYDVYPTFYINSSINYSSGDGTKTNPIRITD